jgi:hypothetical protein
MMVVRGFKTVSNTDYVSISDPWPPNIGDERDIPYAAYVDGPTYVHWDDYYSVARSAPGSLLPPVTQRESEVNRDREELRMPKDQQMDMWAAAAQTRDAAKKSLGTFLRLTEESEGPGGTDAGSAPEIGDPFPVVRIGLDELQGPPGTEPKLASRNESNEILYPILSRNGDVRAGVTFQRKMDDWKDVSYGNKALTRLLVRARQNLVDKSNKPNEGYYAISIPALNLYFVAIKTEGDVTLISLIDDPIVGIKAGIPLSARDIMPRLMKAAHQHDGCPR